MASTKKVFFGSLYDFTEAGVVQFIESLNSEVEQPQRLPFMGYDSKKALFSCTIDADQTGIISNIASQLDKFIFFQTEDEEKAPTSTLMVPIPGTMLDGDLEDEHEQNNDDSSDNSIPADDSSKDGGQQNQPSIYWAPECGSLDILDPQTATKISNMTGTVLIPEAGNSRLKLEEGEKQLALDKLKRMENILTLVHQNRSGVSFRTNNNLVIPCVAFDSLIQFVRPIQNSHMFESVILRPSQAGVCSQIVIGEARVWQGAERMKPRNLELEGIPVTTEVGLCKFLEDCGYKPIGMPISMELDQSRQQSSKVANSTPYDASKTQYLSPDGAARVELWRDDVDSVVDSMAFQQVPAPADEVNESAYRRIVAESSSSDCESESEEGRTNEEHDVVDTGLLPKQANPSNNKAYATVFANDGASDGPSINAVEYSCEQLVKETTHYRDHPSARVSEAESFLGTESPISALASDVSTISDFDPSKYGLTAHMSRSCRRPKGKQKIQTNQKSEQLRKEPLGQPSCVIPDVEPLINFFDDSSDHVEPVENPGPRPVALFAQHNSQCSSYFNLSNMAKDEYSPCIHQAMSDTDKTQSNASQEEDLIDLFSTVSCSQSSAKTKTASSVPASSVETAATLVNFVPRMTRPKRNINYLKSRVMHQLEAQTALIKNTETIVIDRAEEDLPEDQLEQREQEVCKFHNVMSQKMAKPGKGQPKHETAESKEAKQARIAKAMAEAWGSGIDNEKQTARVSQSCTSSHVDCNDMSIRKRKLLKKNKYMAELHAESIRKTNIHDIAPQLLHMLKPVLFAAQAFPGEVDFEVQLGKALMLKNNEMDEKKTYSYKEYAEILKSSTSIATNVIFTSIITTNGRDIDRLLEVSTKAYPSGLWNSSSSEAPSTKYQFSCYDKLSRRFFLNINEAGKYTLVNEPSTISQVAVIVPDQIWDACIVLSGETQVSDYFQNLSDSVREFVSTLYVPGGKTLRMILQHPEDNSFSFDSACVRRVSKHVCLVPDMNHVRMRITEVKHLRITRRYLNDKTLCFAEEGTYEAMVNESRLHYEIAIVDESFQKTFMKNAPPDVGELRPFDTSGGKFLTVPHLHDLIDVTYHTLQSIDWMGASNLGSFRRISDDATQLRTSFLGVLPPTLTNTLPIPTGTTGPIKTHASSFSFANNRFGAPRLRGTDISTDLESSQFTSSMPPKQSDLIQEGRIIHGVRTNTAAELYHDPSTGKSFYYGQGGSRIPIANDRQPVQLASMTSAISLVPADSASHVGDVDRPERFTARQPEPRRGGPRGRDNVPNVGQVADGFW